MNQQSGHVGFSIRRAVGAVLAALLVAAGAAAAGCQKKAEATPGAGADQTAAPGSSQTQEESPAAGAAQEAAPAFHEGNFDLEMTPKGPYKVGQAGEIQVILVAKGAYHVNDKYPIKLKLQPGQGVKYANSVVTKDHVVLEHKKAVMTVGLTPEESGKHQVAGQFAFSICTDDVCLMEKRSLTQAIDVD